MNKKQRLRLLLMSTFIIAVVLIIDELWMFGVPIGPILPDLSPWHIDPWHHWMLGALLLAVVFFMGRKMRREVT